MGKVKDFFGKWFDEEFWGFVVLLLIIAAVSIGFQSLLMWIGGFFPSVEDCGKLIDSILCMLLLLPAFICFGLGSDFKGSGNCLVGLLAIMGIYVSVVWYFHAGILVGCIVLLYSALWRLYKISADPLWTHCGASAYLLYCIGAYFALLFNDIEPAINIYGIVTLIIATICLWFIPASE